MDRKEVFAMLLSAAPEINKTAREKGFWDDKETNPSKKAEKVMLMVSELGEVLEAHRNNIRAKTDITFEQQTLYYNDDWKAWYKDKVKGSIEEEVADVVIRVLDYLHEYNIEVSSYNYTKESTKNFAHDLLRINHYMLVAYHEEIEEADRGRNSYFSNAKSFWSKVFKVLIVFCDWYNIDIVQHVAWKIDYNKQREAMHGKAY